ncbi:hypothetical protein GBAR_LOCUS17135 [Geodia barretti]|uniref:Uncharacterized protein n=1 Tax=Geodia barretti TaxID=519541 RepID=A0AA35SJB2_GEOBA|nr:hypothetical protein GBAR_LOCUS17135 [Geodia barretti]
MPVGDECQGLPPVVSSEPGLQTQGGGEEVEGGRENWEDGKRRSGRRKRKVTASVREEPQQMYSVSEVDCEGAPIRQHIIHHEHHNLSSKRQCPEGYAVEKASNEQQQGAGHFEDVADSLSEGRMEHSSQDMYPLVIGEAESGSRSGDGGESEEIDVDLVAVIRSEQAKVHDLIAKCEEALRQVYTMTA